MDESLIFNIPQESEVNSLIQRLGTSVPSSDPIVELAPDKQFRDGQVDRVPRQGTKLAELGLEVPEPPANTPESRPLRPKDIVPFNLPLNWAYRLYDVKDSSTDDATQSPFREHICLFNVIVAFDWNPKQKYLEQIEAAFQRASDLLFDITDGWMAFGQVIFGGPELMDMADIQIMASNRLHPRSWVAGLHIQDVIKYPNDAKYMPIRIGRGLWNDNRRGIIAWDEPESYRTLIHEWCHYALKMVDEYLETRPTMLYKPADNLLIQASPETNEVGPTVVMLKVDSISESIMATTEGTSELVTGQWSNLNGIYERIDKSRDPNQVRPGPRRVPIALPSFPQLKSTGRLPKQTPSQVFFPKWQDIQEELISCGIPSDILLDQCWLYVLKPDISKEKPWPQRIIAQGTLEARIKSITRKEYRFPLYGAEPDDTIILIGEHRDQPPVVLRAIIVQGDDEPREWTNISPPTFPAIDIIPKLADYINQPVAPLYLRLRDIDQSAMNLQLIDQVIIYPLSQPSSINLTALGAKPSGVTWTSAPTPPESLLTLDGHVFLRWNDGRLLITTFSQGGDGPQSGNPYPANPINAGSADGQALLFMKKQKADDYDYDNSGLIKVITTMVRGMLGTPINGHERSYTFSIASNARLSPQFNPTLIIYHDLPNLQDEREHLTGDMRICRWQEGQGWTAIPTYLPLGFRFAVAPLDATSIGSDAGGTLLAEESPEPRVEYYKVCWVPRNDAPA